MRGREEEAMIRRMVGVLQPYTKFSWMTKDFFSHKTDKEVRGIWNTYKKYVVGICIYEDCGIEPDFLAELGEKQLALF